MLRQLRRFAERMRLQLRVLDLAGRDPRTPLAAKLLVILVVAYALSPIDLIPDFIPVLGYVDDLLLLPLGIYLAMRLVPRELWQELQARAESEQSALPANRRAAVVVVLCWIAAAALLGYWLWR